MEQNPIQNDARKTRRKRAIGEDGMCLLCGYTDSSALIATAAKLLEDHHVAGRSNDPDLTVAICRNCHAEITEGIRQAGADMKPAPTILDKIITILRAAGEFLKGLGEAFQGWAQEIEEILKKLTEAFPTWREICGS